MEEENAQERTVPVIEEELVAGTRDVKTGTMRIRKEVERIEKSVDMPLLRDVVRVTRVAVNRPVPSMPKTREEGDTLIVPVVEEEVVVETRLVLKEEIHIQRRQVKEHVSEKVTLGREHATVEHLDAEGNVTARSNPEQTDSEPRLLKKRKSLLGP